MAAGIGRRMRVRRVRADGHVHRHRDVRLR